MDCSFDGNIQSAGKEIKSNAAISSIKTGPPMSKVPNQAMAIEPAIAPFFTVQTAYSLP